MKNRPESSTAELMAMTAALTAEETLARLQEIEDPAALVRSIPPHDMLVVWNQADEEQKAELLKLADKEQVDLLVDLKCWKGDTPDIDDVENLIGPLALSGADGAARAIHLLDGELRTLLFKRNAKVHVLENRNDDLVVPDTSELIPCSDGYYYIELTDPDIVTDIERALIQALIYQPFTFYQPELECVKHELASDLTETAYKWHCARLADVGFATRQEALALMVPFTVEEVRQAAEDAEPIGYFPSDLPLPVLYRESLRGNGFFDQVMEVLQNTEELNGPARMNSLATELTAVTNLYLSATGVDVGDVDAVSRQITWVRDMLSLGLYETADGDEEEGARLLAVLSPGMFLKAAWGILYPLRDRARRLLSDKKLLPSGRRGAIFDPPYFIGLNCLAKDIPCHWPELFKKETPQHSLFEPGIESLAAFASPKEVLRAVHLLEEAEQLPSLLFDTLKSEQPPVRGTPASILVMNALANAAAERDPVPKPVLKEEAYAFASELLAESEDQLISDALAVFSPLVDVSLDDSDNEDDDIEPMHRLLIRLIRIGRARLDADAPERALLIESF